MEARSDEEEEAGGEGVDRPEMASILHTLATLCFAVAVHSDFCLFTSGIYFSPRGERAYNATTVPQGHDWLFWMQSTQRQHTISFDNDCITPVTYEIAIYRGEGGRGRKEEIII